jgi:hypothetical protein
MGWVACDACMEHHFFVVCMWVCLFNRLSLKKILVRVALVQIFSDSYELATLLRAGIHYGQQLCQNPRSAQKYCAYVLVLPTLFLAVFSTGDIIH